MLYSLLASGIGVAIVSGVFMLIQSRMSINAETRAASKKLTDAKIDELISAFDTMKESNLVILRDRIKYLCRIHIAKGEVPYDERQDLMDMYGIYTERLGGNGNITDLIKNLRDVPVK